MGAGTGRAVFPGNMMGGKLRYGTSPGRGVCASVAKEPKGKQAQAARIAEREAAERWRMPEFIHAVLCKIESKANS